MNRFQKEAKGREIKDKRIEYGLNQKEFAKIWQVPEQRVIEWERGVNLPNSIKIDRMLNHDYKTAKKGNKVTDKGNKVDSGYNKLQAELKKQGRKSVKTKRTKMYHLTENELKKHKKRAEDEAYRKILQSLIYIPLKILEEEEGWKKVRLTRFNNKVCDMLDSLKGDKNILNEISQSMMDKYGIDVQLKE